MKILFYFLPFSTTSSLHSHQYSHFLLFFFACFAASMFVVRSRPFVYACVCACKTKQNKKVGDAGTTFDDKLEYYRSTDNKPFRATYPNLFGRFFPTNPPLFRMNLVLRDVPDLKGAREKFGKDYEPSNEQPMEGVLSFKTYHGFWGAETVCQDGLRDQIVRVVGRGYGNGKFSIDHARTAHELVHHPGSELRVAVIAFFEYRRPKDQKIMMDIAGVMLLSDKVSLEKYDRLTGSTTRLRADHHPREYVRSWCLVQLTILPQYRRHGLGKIALEILPKVMDEITNHGDVVFWAGGSQSKDFFDAVGSTLAPPMIECPFNLTYNDEENRQYFYYMKIKKRNRRRELECRLDRLRPFYNVDPANRCIRLRFNSEILKAYYSFHKSLLFYRLRNCVQYSFPSNR